MSPEIAGNYKEDEWTERLQKCLKLKGIKTEFTAPYRNYDVLKSWKNRLPSGVDNSCLLFQGSPDLIILPEDRAEGILNITSVDEGAGGYFTL